MNRNTLYLVGCWTGVVCLCACLFGPMIAFGLSERNWVAVALPVVMAILVFGVFVPLRRWKMRKVNQKLRRLLQAPTAQDLIAFFQNQQVAGSPLARSAVVAQGCATVYALYGEFDAARSQLKRVNWEKLLPLYQAGGQLVEALLCYLDTRTYEEGLGYAREAQELAATPSIFPGASTSAAAVGLYVEIGEILCGQFTAATVSSLEAKRERLPGLAFLLVEWGLSVAYDKMQDKERADSMRARIREAAPYCWPILLAHN